MTRAMLTLLLLLPVGALGQSGSESEEDQAAMQHQGHEMEMEDPGGLLGEYESNREGSGTTWQPASTPMRGKHFSYGEWFFMAHGFVTGVYNDDPSPRGEGGGFSTNMFMLKALRPTIEGTFGVKVMGSLEPTLGRSGYPLLLQTGETADGVNPLFDRQHPHDLFMELAVTYTLPVTDTHNLFVYFAPVGEPAIGPAVFMNRFSATINPVAPLAHHWLDATHITYGVLTFGFVFSDVAKVEGSFFRGQEPDENRWGLEAPGFDSYSSRFTLNPNPNWSLQVSAANLQEPEVLHPGADMVRVTASATYNQPIEMGNWQTTVAWGVNNRKDATITIPAAAPEAGSPSRALASARASLAGGVPAPVAHLVPPNPGSEPIDFVVPGSVQNAFLAESALRFRGSHFVFGRFEFTEKDELFGIADPRAGTVYNVSKLNGGYLYELPVPGHIGIGLGVTGSVHFIPDALSSVYETNNPTSFMGFVRFILQ